VALIKGTNSYVSLEEASAYFENRIDSDAFQLAGDVTKEQALVTATALLDNYSYIGQSVSSSQPLAFPRIGSYFDSKAGAQVVFTNAIPDRIIKATYELAYHLLNNSGLQDESGYVKEIEIGSIKLKEIQNAPKTSNTVLGLIAPLRNNGSVGRSAIWWRAN
jgi:hypothetical protein